MEDFLALEDCLGVRKNSGMEDCLRGRGRRMLAGRKWYNWLRFSLQCENTVELPSRSSWVEHRRL